MKNPKDNDFAGRRTEAAAAKAALLKAHLDAKDAAEKSRIERQAISAARAERQAERAREKLEAQQGAAVAAEALKAAADAEVQADLKAQEGLEQDRLSRAVRSEADKKAERDQRYANRKARQR